MAYYSNQHITIHWDGQAQAVFAEWHTGPPTSDEFRDALDRGLDLLREQGATKWMADTRKFTYPSPEDEAWSMNDWFPRALQAGMKYLAIVMPENEYHRLAVHGRVTEMAEAGMVTAYFDSVASAREWMRGRS